MEKISKFIKLYYPMILIGIIIIVACSLLTGFGITSGLDNQYMVEAYKSTYSLTTFNYDLIGPSREQVSKLKSDGLVSGILPVYRVIQKNGNQGINVLVTDYMDDFKVGIFNDDTLVAGDLSKEGAIIDINAANMLNLSLGDNYVFQFDGKYITYEVTAICLPSSYNQMDQGLILIKANTEIMKKFNARKGYDFAFLDVKNLDMFNDFMSDYIPYGILKTQDAFIAEFKESHNKPTDKTDAEWEESIIVSYNTYIRTKEGIYSEDSVRANMSHSKELLGDNIIAQADKMQINSNKKIIGYAVGVPIIFSVLFLLAFVIEIRIKRTYYKLGGVKLNYLSLVDSLIVIMSIIIIELVTIITYFVSINNSIYFASMNTIILKMALPVLCGLILIPIAFFINKMLDTKIHAYDNTDKVENYDELLRVVSEAHVSRRYRDLVVNEVSSMVTDEKDFSTCLDEYLKNNNQYLEKRM